MGIHDEVLGLCRPLIIVEEFYRVAIYYGEDELDQVEILHYPVATIEEALKIADFYHAYKRAISPVTTIGRPFIGLEVEAFNGEDWEQWQTPEGRTAAEHLAELREEQGLLSTPARVISYKWDEI